MSVDNYYVVKTTSIVKASNMAKARLLASGQKADGEILNEKYEVEHKEEFDISNLVSKADSKYLQSNRNDSIDEDEEDEDVSSHSSFLTINEDTVNYLRAENKRLLRLAEKNKNAKGEAVESVYQAALDAFSEFTMPVSKKPVIKQVPGIPETAVAVFADWQLGKVTPDYNSNVTADRIELYTEKLIEITEIQRKHHPVNNLHVWLLGDIVEGEEIFPGQAHLIDSGLYRQVGINGPEILVKFLKTALENFEHIHVTGVIGNHGAIGGRARKQHDPESNMDRLLYQIVRLIFADEPRITFNIPDGKGERHWYAVDSIGNHSSLLIHGDQLPSPNAFHGYYKKIMGWKDGAIPEHFDDVFMGHYHQSFKMTIGSATLRISGSPESYNTYAQEFFSSMSRPSQQLMYIHPENGITCEYTIWLDAV